ncbi:hypothetical protein IC620_15310 [Hazenella sp. IB182357]|uniref:Phage protein n=1 Tax=Polycladospora coralii TaxID=2771432 RepID=A0A926NI55_9BACL|nr:hypothetical protein [Polycladospora coralii]MBD1373713.1 hypothetical protein [Polycladospora coralii]
MLKIKLNIDGENKTFTQDFISGRMFRKAIELEEEQNQHLAKIQKQSDIPVSESIKLIEALYHFICEVFDKQFTLEQYEDGIDARKIMDHSWTIVNAIIGQVIDPLGLDESDEDKKKTTA